MAEVGESKTEIRETKTRVKLKEKKMRRAVIRELKKKLRRRVEKV